MLQEISIKNFAIIDTIAMQFEQGMSILTVKQVLENPIIIDAMNLLLGSRAQTSFVRHGADKAEMKVYFSISKTTQKLPSNLRNLALKIQAS
jgi:DNA repair protein RecN (Recombination protein N)